ncbi:MAG: ATP-binding protein [Candidatus Omnitrophota bacterium]
MTMAAEHEGFTGMHIVYLCALGALLSLIWSKYFRSLKIEHRDPSLPSDKWTGSDSSKPAYAPGATLDIVTDRASEAITKLRDDGFAKEADIILEEVNKKVGSIVKEKDIQFVEIDRKYKQTLIEKKQIDSIVRSVAEGLVVLNDRGEVIMMNPAAEKLLDVDKADQMGKPMRGSIKKSQMMSLARHEEGTDETEIEMESSSDDAKKTLRASNAVIENENGQTIGMVSVFTDVTKQKELDAMKTQFVSNISHELRTPLIAIRNSVEIMLTKKTGPLTEAQDKFLTIAENNLKRLGLLIDDLLDLSKVEAKKAEIHLEPSDIGQLIKETCDSFEAWANTKEISIARNVQRDIREVNIDRKRITQVLTNLVGNSIKFTPKSGTVKVTANIIQIEGKDTLVVSVADTGIGIAQEDLPKLFNKFQQLGGSDKSVHHVSGTGLGLYISKELIALHGGTIYAKSEVGRGSTFVFKIPV